MRQLTLDEVIQAGEQLFEQQDLDSHLASIRQWMIGTYGPHPAHENAYQQAWYVRRLILARNQFLEAETLSPASYIGAAILVAGVLDGLHAEQLGRPSEEIQTMSKALLNACLQIENEDPYTVGIQVEAFVQGCVNIGVRGDAQTGFKLRAGGLKGVAAAKNPNAPNDQNIYAAFVDIRPTCSSDREAHLAVAKQFALPMPPSDAGRKRVMRAVKKCGPKK